MLVDRIQRREIRRCLQELCASNYLPSQVTGERADGHLGQRARHEPLLADLTPVDEVERNCRSRRKHCV
jgi:hypothetical protein